MENLNLTDDGTEDVRTEQGAGEEQHAERPPAGQTAKEKLEKELDVNKDKDFADPVIGHLLKRCEEDAGLAEDVMQEHKTWDKCRSYIFEQARKQAHGNRAAIRDEVVYEWAEDYFHKDDKAEEEKKAREKEARKKQEEERKKKAAENSRTASIKAGINADKKDSERPAKPRNNSKKDIEGQMDLFSLM